MVLSHGGVIAWTSQPGFLAFSRGNGVVNYRSHMLHHLQYKSIHVRGSRGARVGYIHSILTYIHSRNVRRGRGESKATKSGISNHFHAIFGYSLTIYTTECTALFDQAVPVLSLSNPLNALFNLSPCVSPQCEIKECTVSTAVRIDCSLQHNLRISLLYRTHRINSNATRI